MYYVGAGAAGSLNASSAESVGGRGRSVDVQVLGTKRLMRLPAPQTVVRILTISSPHCGNRRRWEPGPEPLLVCCQFGRWSDGFPGSVRPRVLQTGALSRHHKGSRRIRFSTLRPPPTSCMSQDGQPHKQHSLVAPLRRLYMPRSFRSPTDSAEEPLKSRVIFSATIDLFRTF